jgi:hypothetical protein
MVEAFNKYSYVSETTMQDFIAQLGRTSCLLLEWGIKVYINVAI